MKNAIDIRGLTVYYQSTLALWDINISIVEGSLICIVGPNGAGKSTFVKALMNQALPASGEIKFYGQTFNDFRQRLAYIPQINSIEWDFPMTVFDVALMGRYSFLKGLKWYRKADKVATERVLETLNLLPLRHKQIGTLSGGQRQRLFLARALLQNADIYLLDEPFAGLDAVSEKMILDILKEQKKRNKTILIVHHDLKTAADHFDKAILLNTSLISYENVCKALSEKNLALAYHRQHGMLNEVTTLSNSIKSGLHH